MAIADVNAIIQSYLLTSAPLVALVNSRIYCPRLPENATLPAVSYFVRGGLSTPYIPGIVNPSVQFDCWAANPIDARKVYRALYDALQGIQNQIVTIDGSANVMFLCEEDNSILSSWDISNPIRPVKLDELVFSGVAGALTINRRGNFVFIAARETNAVHSVDISNPKALKLADTLADAVNLNGPHGSDLFGDYLYVCCFDGDMFTIVDISDPYNLALRGSATEANFDGVHDVVVALPYAYVTSHYGTGGGPNDGEIACVDVSDPDNPIVISLSTEKSQFAHIVKRGNSLFAGGTDLAGGYLYAYDISTPTTLTFVSKLLGGFGYWIALTGSKVVSCDANTRLRLLDVSDPASMSILDAWFEAGVGDMRNVVIKDNKYVYVSATDTDEGGGVFKVFEIMSDDTLELRFDSPLISADPAWRLRNILIAGNYSILSAIEEVQGQDLVDAEIPNYFRVVTSFEVGIRAE